MQFTLDKSRQLRKVEELVVITVFFYGDSVNARSRTATSNEMGYGLLAFT